jgi:electron transfer flavoprotein alpha subunit
MPTLLLAEHDNKSLKDATNKALTVAKALGTEVHVLVAGSGCKAVADAAAKLDGVSKVLLADAPAYAHMLAEPIAALIVALAGPYETIMAAATTSGKNIMPRVAALLDVMQISDVIKVVAPDTFERPIYAGNAIQTVRSRDAKKVITVRTAAFQATGEGGSATVEAAAAAADPGISGFVGEELSKSERPELTSAKIIISARRRGRRLARRGRCRLRAKRLAGRPDRQGGGAGSLYRRRHIGRHSAPRRHERFESHRRDQQG